jgi:hypothetical protein
VSFTPTDLVLLRGIKEGIAWMRANPYILDWVFERLIEEGMDLQKSYGQQEINRAKTWFLKNHIDVRMAYNLDGVKFPCVSIGLLNQNESKPHATLGDVAADIWNEDVSENPYVIKARTLVGPFPNVSYDIATGIVTIPEEFDTELIFVNQALYSPASGREYIITKIIDEQSFLIETNLREDFSNSYISPAYKTLKAKRGIAQFSETYDIRILVQGDQGELVWLHTIISYLLLKFRQDLLEKKNIGLTSISSGPIQQESSMEFGGENVFSRAITMDALIEVTWLKTLSERIEGTIFTFNFEEVQQTS